MGIIVRPDMMNLKEEEMQNRLGFIDTGKNSEQNTDSTGIKTQITKWGFMNLKYFLQQSTRPFEQSGSIQHVKYSYYNSDKYEVFKSVNNF